VKPEEVTLSTVLLLASTTAEALNAPDGEVNIMEALYIPLEMTVEEYAIVSFSQVPEVVFWFSIEN